MGTKSGTRSGGLAAALLLTSVLSTAASAQNITTLLPTLFVTSSRLGVGITGTSTSIITKEEIERSPERTLQDILSLQPGVQVQDLFGGVNGVGSAVDMRGFGAFATANTLVLINGRRINDIDLAGVDLSAVPLQSIERVEITRGNSGAVLYGDGAVGGVVNIITKNGVGAPPSLRIGGAFGSFNQREGVFSANSSVGPFSAAAFANAINSDGYRVNNALMQRNGIGELRYNGNGWGGYFNITADDQSLGLPGERQIRPGLGINELVTDRRGAATPFNYADKQGLSATAGVTRMLGETTELIVDAGVRRKLQQAAYFDPFGVDFDRYVDTVLTTLSLTPRINDNRAIAGLPVRSIFGADVQKSIYQSDRARHAGEMPSHRFDIDQLTVAAYGQTTVTVRPDTDISAGARVQGVWLSATDALDSSAPGGLFVAPQGLPLDTNETQYAWHVGFEHRLSQSFALFARAARSFRLPNVDERVGQALFGVPTTFELKTQTSHDFEGGVRLQQGPLSAQASAYLMYLKNEIHFDPLQFINYNLDPTKRYGVETMVSYQVNEAVQLKGGGAYTRAVFREGPFTGNDVPLVSRWSATGGVSWTIVPKQLVLDAVARYFGPRRHDNDQANFQPEIAGYTLVDLRIGGEVEKLHWSFAVQNLFDVEYYNYGVASAFTFGNLNVYPLPGRTFLLRAAIQFGG